MARGLEKYLHSGVRDQFEASKLGQTYLTASTLETWHGVSRGTYGSMAAVEAWKALQLVLRDPRIRRFLEENDPMALQQIESAGR